MYVNANSAPSVQRIAAIVNDDIISGYDLQQRMILVLSTSGVRPSEEVIKRLQEQVLRTLVEEQLQMQEAERNEVDVPTNEIAQAITQIGAQNNLSRDQIVEFLNQSGINITTLQNQVYAELAWNKLVGQRFGARVFISPEEVEGEYQRMLENSSKPQYLVSEILLGVDSPERDGEVRQTAERMLDQIRSGAPFQAVANQFSQAASSANGGEVGWVQEGQLAPEIDNLLVQMSPGTVAGPIRAIAGYYLIYMRDRRETAGGSDAMKTRLNLKQILVPVAADAPDSEVTAAVKRAQKIGTKLNGCTNIETIARNEDGAVFGDLGDISGAQLTESFRTAVIPLRSGEISAPVRSQNGFHLLAVCSKEAATVEMPTRGDIENRLYAQQITMMARRYLRDLRRDAVVELR
jgi:peptidyl-prolyl cis-trans isomerase SurA